MTADVSAPPAPAEGYGESTKRERVGWYFYDWANSAFSTTLVAVFLGPYLTAVAKTASGCVDPNTADNVDPCISAPVQLFGMTLKAGSVYPAVVTISVVLNVLLLPVVGAIADRSAHKRRMLAIFAYVGATATTCMFFVTGGAILLGALLTIIATMAFAASIVVYNSFLPQLCPEEDRDKVSSRGWAFGYLGGGLLLLLNLVALTLLEAKYGTSIVVRASMASAGIWWGVFTLLPLRRLRDRPPLEGVVHGNVLTGGFKQLGRTIKGLKAYPLTLFFLGAYLIYNDGIQTVINLSSTYADQELKLGQSVLVITVLLVQFLAFGGALGLGFLAGRIGAWKTVLISLVLWTGVIIGAFSLPTGEAVPFMILGACIGLVLGGSQALSRSLFSQLIPKGKEAEYFGFFEISDKGTSWLGPLAFALVFELTNSYRVGLVSLLIFFVIGFFLLLAVPMRRAIMAAGNTPPTRL